MVGCDLKTCDFVTVTDFSQVETVTELPKSQLREITISSNVTHSDRSYFCDNSKKGKQLWQILPIHTMPDEVMGGETQAAFTVYTHTSTCLFCKGTFISIGYSLSFPLFFSSNQSSWKKIFECHNNAKILIISTNKRFHES